MKICTKCLEQKSLGDFYKNADYSDGHTYWCKDCIKAKSLAWYDKNKRSPRPPKMTKDEIRAYDRQRSKIRRQDPERKAYHLKKTSEWLKKNPAFMRERNARNRLIVKRATPKWANKFFIDEIYRLAPLREKITGGKWHVDHIVPLNHPKVCGLHVENNLQVIPASRNIAKSNQFWPHM